MIEVGEYIRLARNQGINKIIDKKNDRYILESEILTESGDMTYFLFECELKDEIVKHSKQLIDLIECGDFVNGYRVTDKYLFAGKRLVLETEGDDTNCKCLCEEDIKTILTKEQIEANCYKVGGE